MMVALIRSALNQTISAARSAHAGLLLTHALAVFEEGEKTEKARLIDTITGVGPSELYQKAFARWMQVTCKPERFAHLTGTLAGRLMIGLSTGGAMETGVLTQHSYGMPMIPGSSVKGAVRHYAESIGLDAQYIAVLFGADDELAKEPDVTEGAGYLIWHDAWWIPGSAAKPFVGEVVTVHHQDYYGGQGDATDFDSPVPNQQLAVQGSFYFVVEGDPAWTSLAQTLLRDTLRHQGLGAKRAAGYGYLHEDSKTSKAIDEQRKRLGRITMTAEEKIHALIKSMDPKSLPENLGTKRTAFFNDNQITSEQFSLVIDAVREHHGGLVESWKGETKKTNKPKFKAYKFMTGTDDDQE